MAEGSDITLSAFKMLLLHGMAVVCHLHLGHRHTSVNVQLVLKEKGNTASVVLKEHTADLCVHGCECTNMCVQMCVYKCVYVQCVYRCVCVHMCVHIRLCMYMRVCTYVCVHMNRSTQ